MSEEIQAHNSPLVSIVVITYNSAKYVLETLESVKIQTYRNIELIISDDCSTDSTIEICRNWLALNEQFFHRTKLISTKNNTGIASNCNRGLKESKGEWIKYIAGDDILLSACIETFVAQTQKCSELFHFSLMQYSQKSEHFSNLFEESFKLFQKEESQIKILLERNCLPAPASFIHKETLLKLNGFDERFPMYEDYPLWIKAQREGYRFNCFDNRLVVYRIHNDSVTNNQDSNKNISPFFKSQVNFYKKVLCFQQLKHLRLVYFLLTIRKVISYYKLFVKSVVISQAE